MSIKSQMRNLTEMPWRRRNGYASCKHVSHVYPSHLRIAHVQQLSVAKCIITSWNVEEV